MSSPPNDTRIAHGNVRSMRVLLALLVATLFTGAVLVNSFLHRQRDTQMCEMSYSRPLFVPLTPGPNSRLRNKYTLYLYREGLIDDVQKLRGTPALFIPGHAGSYRQARSIAAEAAYYHQNHPQSARFDFFTVDLNEEFSALSGQLLLDQAEFLNDAVAFIQQMYPHPAPILIVGHSMGGVVARLLFALPNYRPGSIDTVLTLATPHAVAPILVDPKLFRVYDTISRYGYEQRKSLENVTLVSLAGGTLDSIVNSDAASISQLFPRSHSLTAFSTAIPNVWTGCDHMAILWCNQLVKVVAASLSESLRKDHRSSVDARMKVFKSYFLSRSLLSGWPELNYLLNVTTINHSDVKSLSLHWPKQSETAIHILPKRIDDVGTIKILTNVDVSKSDKISVLLCQQTSKCIDASTAAIQLPATMPAQHKVSFIELDQRSLDAYDIVGILQKPDPNSGFLLLERSLRSQIEVTKSLLEIAMTGVSLNLSSTMHTHISIPCMYHPILALRVHISMPTIPKFKPILQQTLGDQGESKYFVVTGNSTLDVNFHADPAPDPSKYLHLHFWKQDPIQIHLSIDWYGSLGKSLLRCGPSMIIYTFVTSLTIMSYQVETFINSGISISFPVALIHCLKRRFPILIAIGSIAQLFATESGIFSKLALGYQGSLWWLFATFFCLSIGLLVLLWVVMTALLHMAKFVAVPMASSANIYILAATVIALVRVLPVPVIVVVLYVYWLGVTGLTLSQKQWKEYYNQQTILLLLTTLLPYNIPAVVIFIRDIVAVGWSGRVVTLSAVLDDIPMLAATFFCIMLGRRCYFPRWLPTMLHLTVLYYILFGVQVPFPIHALSTRL